MDRLLDREVEVSRGDARERMPAHHREVEDQDGQAEEVVIGRPVNAREVPPVQLGRGEFGDAHPAAEDPQPFGDLERVAVDERDDPLPGNQDVLLIHVADHVAARVDHLEGDGAVAGGVEEEAPIRLGEFFFALGDAVEAMDLDMVRDPGHQDPVNRRGVARGQRGGRPGRDLEEVGMAEPDHGPELVAPFRGRGRFVELRDHAGMALDVEDRPLAAFRERRRRDPDLDPEMVTQSRRIGWEGHRG